MLLAVHYRVMEHVGSLESTQEARVALAYLLGQLLRFLRALQTSRITWLAHVFSHFTSATCIYFNLSVGSLDYLFFDFVLVLGLLIENCPYFVLFISYTY